MSFSMINLYPLPYYNERKLPINMLVIHSMAHNAAEGIKQLETLKLSVHYVIDYDGRIFQCVSEDKRAWHAGVSYWRKITDINSCSIGIEVCHRSLGQSKFNQKQIKSLIDLSRDIINRYHIAPTMIVGHSDIAPKRKPDPGKDFPWRELAANNIGIWFGSRFSSENDIIKMLSDIGYDTEDEISIKASSYAFCRRFLSGKIKKRPVRKVLEHPFDDEDENLLKDKEFIKTLQNVHYQYLMYEKNGL